MKKRIPLTLVGITLAACAANTELPNYKSFPLVKSITYSHPVTKQGYYKEWYDENAQFKGKHPHFVATYLICEGKVTKKPTGLSDNKTGNLYILTKNLTYRKVTKKSTQEMRQKIDAAKKEAKKTGDNTKLMELVEQAQRKFKPAFQYCDEVPKGILVPRTKAAEYRPIITQPQKHL